MVAFIRLLAFVFFAGQSRFRFCFDLEIVDGISEMFVCDVGSGQSISIRIGRVMDRRESEHVSPLLNQ